MTLDVDTVFNWLRRYLWRPLLGGQRSLMTAILHTTPYALIFFVLVLSYVKASESASWSNLALWNSCYYLTMALGLYLLFSDIKSLRPLERLINLALIPWRILYWLRLPKIPRPPVRSITSPYGLLPYGYGSSSPFENLPNQPMRLPSPDAIPPLRDLDASWQDGKPNKDDASDQ